MATDADMTRFPTAGHLDSRAGVCAGHHESAARLCRTELSGICGWLVRQGGLIANAVREATPLEAGSTKRARAMDAEQIAGWLSVVDASEYARRWDRPDLILFILGTRLLIGEALGCAGRNVALDLGTLNLERTGIRVRGQGLKAKALQTRSSARVLVLPGRCVRLLETRLGRVALGREHLLEEPVHAGGAELAWM